MTDPQLGKTHEAIDHRRHPRSDRFPVVYVTVPPAATPRMLAVEFARFFGIQLSGAGVLWSSAYAGPGRDVRRSWAVVVIGQLRGPDGDPV